MGRVLGLDWPTSTRSYNATSLPLLMRRLFDAVVIWLRGLGDLLH